MTSLEWTVILLATTGSALIKNSVGIGAGIFLLPVLALVLPAKVALGIGAPMMLLSDAAACRSYYKAWDADELRLLLPSALIGIALGVFLVDIIPPEPFRKIVGAAAGLFAGANLWQLSRPARPEQARHWSPGRGWGRGIGFLGGMASTLAHAGGIVWSVYLMQKDLTKRAFVATIVIMFFLTNIIKTVSFFFIGILDGTSLAAVLVSIPFVLAGAWAGTYINNKIPMRIFRYIVLCIIGALGLQLLFT